MAIAAILFGLALIGIRDAIASSGPTAGASRTLTVSIPGFAYRPAALRVGVGTSVVFSNRSGTAHTATRRGSFDTGRIKPGKAVAVRFARKGTFAYHCTLHPFMHGKIVVG
jgi:plastocyanin